MNSMTRPGYDQRMSGETSQLAQQIDTAAWSVFFIWVGIAMLIAIPWGCFFLGVGLLILATQFVRWQANMKVEGLWVAIGVVWLASGIWTLLNLSWSLGPILLILLGVVLLGKTVIGFFRSDSLHGA